MKQVRSNFVDCYCSLNAILKKKKKKWAGILIGAGISYFKIGNRFEKIWFLWARTIMVYVSDMPCFSFYTRNI